MKGICKRFPGVQALDGVDFTLRRGEIHALMGENGAGKSTLIKVLTGVYPRDGGRVLLDDRPINPGSPQEAQAEGISTVYQEVNLIPGLSVAENIFLGRQPRRWGRIDWRTINRRAAEVMRRLDLDLDVTQPLASYSIAIQQMVAIARALDISAHVLILDEPTSSLDAGEVERLFALMRKLRDEGLGIVFVTHFLDQVYAVSDRITVLRNGRLVGEYETARLPRLELIGRMIGRDASTIENDSSDRGAIQASESAFPKPFLQATGLARRSSLEPFDLALGPGEVVGLAGLLGSGRTEMVRMLFGVDPAEQGTLTIDDRPVVLRGPRQAIGFGFGFCPEDRKAQGIIPDLSVRENIVLALQAQRGWLRRLSQGKQQALASRFIKALNIATSDAEKPIKFLSGGNQQKVLLARWLAMRPRLLMLDEPTRGIDVGAKFEIAHLIEELRREGLSILFISSELEEVVRSCQRVAVLRDRRKVAELIGSEISESRIMAAIAQPVATDSFPGT